MPYNLNIIKPSKTEMCPPGYHIVKGHYRKCKSGVKTWVDTHKRKNRSRSKKITYYSENLLYLYWNSEKSYKKLKRIKPFPAYHELDAIIQFWLKYWESKLKKFPKLDPLLIKAIIAKESSFNPKADPKVAHSTAYGLMQIVDKSRAALSKRIDSSVSMEYIDVSREDLEDPVVNIAVGTRWLVVKYFLLRKKDKGNINKLVKLYYGHREEKENDRYLKKVLEYYNTSL